MQPTIETERLILTWPSDEQIKQYYSDIVGTNIFDTIQWDGPSGPDDIRDYWNLNKTKSFTNFKLALPLAMIEKKSNLYIGGLDLRPINQNPEISDIGYALAPKFHNKGYATEAVRALVNEAFVARKAERIMANVFVGNEASRNVVKKLGFQFEGTLRRVIKKRGVWLDEWSMAITRPDWERLNLK